jgi:hypothetical protein
MRDSITVHYISRWVHVVFTNAHFTAPPALSLIVLVHLLDKEEFLWIQVTNTVKGTLSSPSCRNPYSDSQNSKDILMAGFVLWSICHELYFCVD